MRVIILACVTFFLLISISYAKDITLTGELLNDWV